MLFPGMPAVSGDSLLLLAVLSSRLGVGLCLGVQNGLGLRKAGGHFVVLFDRYEVQVSLCAGAQSTDPVTSKGTPLKDLEPKLELLGET